MPVETIYKSPSGEHAVQAAYDALLARWPVPNEQRFVRTRLGDAFVIACGAPAAPPLILLHGAGSNSAMWLGDVAAYSRTHRVYAVDLCGEPGKSAQARPAWDGAAYAEWLEDVCAALQVPQAALAGLSQGGFAALKFATRHPERVTRLVLLAPGGIVPDRASFLLRAVPLLLLGHPGAKRVMRLLSGKQALPPDALDYFALLLTHVKPSAGRLPVFATEELQRLAMPVLVVLGALDPLRDTPKIAARLRAVLPQAQVVILPEGGHALAGTASHIVPFLAAGLAA